MAPSSTLGVKPLFFLLLLCALAAPSFALFCGHDNCFEILGIPRNSTKAEVRRAYRRLSSEQHPDKRPNDPEAKENFRKLGTAYETLTDNAKRAKYEDFLDNPGKYWQYLINNAREVYAPKSNVVVVMMGLLAIMTLIHWLNMNNTYKETLRRMRETQEFKREVTRLVKSKLAANRELAEAMINLDVVGLEEPHWRDLIVFKIARIPVDIAKYIMWRVRWFVSYKIRKCEYSDEDKLYLMQKNLGISDESWQNVSEKEVSAYLAAEVWDKEKCDDFMRIKKIELNRLGKGKKKKKHSAVPYSETEEVSMSD